ncbi:uncharacterized protein LOC117654304 [Thrips palmi]|uniref:Uncharacterized protein LOC117654304 n=1 Tax=Thrips palmi TaxID=161013 RepID=A0A6P9AHC5_THRPL|nr:uncharacterized protein LOC117654304 [Thrips palmi]
MLPLAAFLLAPVFLSLVQSKTIQSFAGPYIAFSHLYNPCPSQETFLIQAKISHFNPSRPYDLQTVFANMSLKEDFSDGYWASATMAVRSNNQWKENAIVFNFPRKGCSVIREHFPDMYRFFAEATGTPVADKTAPCVFRKGNYVMTEPRPVNATFPSFPVLPYGRYKYRGTLRRTSTSPVPLACLEMDCEIIPKP